MVYFKKFEKDGVASVTTFDDGLESSAENPKRLLSVLIQTSEYHEDNYLEGWWEREKIFEIPIQLIDTPREGGQHYTSRSFNRLNEIEVGMDIPVGSTFMVAIKCGTHTVNIIGAYRYEIVK